MASSGWTTVSESTYTPPSSAWLDEVAESGISFMGDGERGSTMLERGDHEYEIVVRRAKKREVDD